MEDLMFDVEIEVEEGLTLCRLIGELDSFTVRQFHGALDRVSPTSRLLIDLSEVPFIDSAGLWALVGRIRGAREAGAQVAVCSSQATTNRALRVSGFDEFVTVTATREEAIQALRPEPHRPR